MDLEKVQKESTLIDLINKLERKLTALKENNNSFKLGYANEYDFFTSIVFKRTT